MVFYYWLVVMDRGELGIMSRNMDLGRDEELKKRGGKGVRLKIIFSMFYSTIRFSRALKT